MCAGTDGGRDDGGPLDAGSDVGSDDAWVTPPFDAWTMPMDGDTPDAFASPDAFVPDTGVVCPAPFVVCGGTCLDPRTNPTHCGASGSCTGSTAGATCPGACSGGRCLWDSCSAALAAGASTGDGLYLVDVDGAGPAPARDAYCDMTTAGGGWTLVYRLRNDVADISDPWWGMVAIGSGDALPTSATTLPAGTHFEGPTRDVRSTFYSRNNTPTAETRVTTLSSSGTRLIDVRQIGGSSAGPYLVQGSLGSPPIASGLGGGTTSAVISSMGIPSASAGTVGTARFASCASGTCNDYETWAASGGTTVPLFGDASLAGFDARFTNSTTLFWVRTFPGGVWP